jgi:long-subunit fatty acid transport protein
MLKKVQLLLNTLRSSLLACATVPLFCIPSANAALMENLGIGVVPMSMGNAVTADPSGLDALHFNPAGLSRLTGTHQQWSVFGASVRPRASFSAPEGFDVGGWSNDPVIGAHTGPVRNTVYLPALGKIKGVTLPFMAGGSIAYSFNEPGVPWTFALGAYPSLATNFERTKDPNDPSRFSGREVTIQRLAAFTPGLSYKVNNTLSLGVVVPFSHQAFVLNTDLRFPNPLLGTIGNLQQSWCGANASNPVDLFLLGLCSGPEGQINPFKSAGNIDLELTSSMDPTVNLGALWEPLDKFALGAVYRGGSDSYLQGRYQVNSEPMLRNFTQGLFGSLLGPIIGTITGLPSNIPAVQKGNARMRFPVPETIQVGMKFKPIRQWQVNFDLGWTNWKRWDKLTVEFDQPIALLQTARLFGVQDSSKLVLKRGYRNTITMGVGVQYQPTEKVTVRAGYEKRPSSVSPSVFDLIAPLPDMQLFGVGLGYKFDKKSSIDVGASLVQGSFNIPAGQSCNMNCSDFFNLIYNPYAGLNVRGNMYIRYFGMSFSRVF